MKKYCFCFNCNDSFHSRVLLLHIFSSLNVSRPRFNAVTQCEPSFIITLTAILYSGVKYGSKYSYQVCSVISYHKMKIQLFITKISQNECWVGFCSMAIFALLPNPKGATQSRESVSPESWKELDGDTVWYTGSFYIIMLFCTR